MTTTEIKPLVTWTSFNGEWMLRSTTRLDEGSIVEVAKKNGGTSTVKVGEYEKRFKTAEGEVHIFSICRA